MAICPTCQTEVNDYTETYISPYNHQEYKKYECPNCDVHWWEPLKIIPEFYEEEALELYVSFHEELRKSLNLRHKVFFECFPKNKKGKLLDVGCGNGMFLKETQKHSFEVWGIDFDKKSIEAAKKNLGINTVYNMSLEKFYNFVKEKNIKFDVITFFEVLEHQDRPMEFLQMVKELLKDGGYIAGSVPNREGLFRKIDWKYFKTDYPPHHFLRFSQTALYKTLELAGFKNVEIIKLDFPKEELPFYLEKKLFGNIDKLKIWLKSKAIGNRRIASSLAVEDIDKFSCSIFIPILKILKNLRNIILYPFTLPYWGKSKEKENRFYFQAVNYGK